MARKPGYCHHKPTGQAYVRLDGKVIYLGAFGTDLRRERYNRLKAEWLHFLVPTSTGVRMHYG